MTEFLIGTGRWNAGLKQPKVNAIRSKLPFILQVLAPRPKLQMLRIDAATIIAAVANHVVIASHHLLQDAEDEPVGRHLPPLEPHPSPLQRRRFDATSFRDRPVRQLMEAFRYFDFRDDSQRCWDEILDTQKEAAQSLAHALFAAATLDENGCRVTDTTTVR